MKSNRTRDEHDNTDRWVVSYADFITLLFAFFTAMYAISQVDTGKLNTFTGSVRNAFSSENTTASVQMIEGISPLQSELFGIENELNKSLSSISAGRDISVRKDSRGVILSFGDRVLFETGHAEIKTSAAPALAVIVPILKKLPNTVIIEGHTDNVPLAGTNARYASNWELSMARATNVLNYLIKNYDLSPARFAAAGYAEFRPVALNETPEGRLKNRRVDIVVLRSDTKL